MGCGASAPQQTASAKSYGGPPELSGKSKFLSNPVTSEFVHPTTFHRWMMICYAPVTPPWAFVIVAKNMTLPRAALLVKDVSDAELTAEKESQKVSMSWNIFFKAIASEIGRLGKGGASFSFTEGGTLDLECRIALSSTIATKKTDTYRCTLQCIPDTFAAMFKYVATPLTVLYCKRRTDIVERPDSTKDRQLGELEAAFVTKQSRQKEANREVDKLSPVAAALRTKYDEIKVRQRTAVAISSIARQRQTTSLDRSDAWLHKDIFDSSPTFHADPLTNTLDATSRAAVSASTLFFEHISVYPDPVQRENPILVAIEEAESEWGAVGSLHARLGAHGQGIGALAAYMLYRFVAEPHRRQIDTSEVMKLAQDIERIVSLQSTAQQQRAVVLAGSFLCMLATGRLQYRLALKGGALFTAVLASLGLCFHQEGSSNIMHIQSGTLLSNLYPTAPQQRHAAARLNSLVHKYATLSTFCDAPALASMLACTTCYDAPLAREASRFLLRSREIRDFGRTTSDRSLACGAALSVSFLRWGSATTPSPEDGTEVALLAVKHSAHDVRGGLADDLVTAFGKLFPEALPPGISLTFNLAVTPTA